jgi:hypothetical protein
MIGLGPWHTKDFDTLSWHDAHVHGLRLDNFKSNLGAADLVLDIDFILDWESVKGAFQFTVSRADLRFHEVFGLKIALDYAASTAGMCAFSIAGIERALLTFPTGATSYRWRIPINWPSGAIEFDAPGFTQTLIGASCVQSGQCLDSKNRNNGIGA